MKANAPATVDEYIRAFPLDVQDRLQELRRVIRKAAPAAEERISYQMPAFFQDGVLVYFGAHGKHIGFYPTARGLEEFRGELGELATSKGTVQLPYAEPLPRALIAKIVKFKVKDNAARKKPGKG